MKDELGGDIITEFVALRPKAYSYITNNFIEMKKAKGTKKCGVKKMVRFGLRTIKSVYSVMEKC